MESIGGREEGVRTLYYYNRKTHPTEAQKGLPLINHDNVVILEH